jgi:type 1 fimbria pilin
MKTTSLFCAGALSLAMLVPASNAFSTDLSLSLNVTGTIIEGPSWEDGSSNDITTASFSFASVVPGSANQNVDSAEVAVVLKAPSSSGQILTVAYVSPSSCSVGSSAVHDSHVKLVFGNTEFGNSNLSFTESSSAALKLRFIDDGGYGDKFGAVSCTGAGSLTYTY